MRALHHPRTDALLHVFHPAGIDQQVKMTYYVNCLHTHPQLTNNTAAKRVKQSQVVAPNRETIACIRPTVLSL